ncbi:MAG TPA: 3-isopropylmalate dehydratase small subunit [Nocardioidaceae bacterium]|nr:3-isopropylmalate dehydratase small subunit [Nocardioidaceae bacterium]
MLSFTTHRGTAVPLRRGSVDTDQIIPARYLKRVTRAGYGEGLFAEWRADPAFVLNDPRYAGASVLLVGPEFGIGSSREHAVWALLDYGFRAVVGSSFGDIFRVNAGKAGLLAAVVDEVDVHRMCDLVEQQPDASFEVDLEHRTVTSDSVTVSFEIDDHTRRRLLQGVDEIGVAMTHEAEISSYEGNRAVFLPRTIP